jgi:hypothetical protein
MARHLGVILHGPDTVWIDGEPREFCQLLPHMDERIRAAMHRWVCWISTEQFVDLYRRAHEEVLGESWPTPRVRLLLDLERAIEDDRLTREVLRPSGLGETRGGVS